MSALDQLEQRALGRAVGASSRRGPARRRRSGSARRSRTSRCSRAAARRGAAARSGTGRCRSRSRTGRSRSSDSVGGHVVTPECGRTRGNLPDLSTSDEKADSRIARGKAPDGPHATLSMSRCSTPTTTCTRPTDALTKYLPDRYKSAIDYVEVRGPHQDRGARARSASTSRTPPSTSSPGPGAQEDYFRNGNPEGKSRREIFGEPMRAIPAFREPAPRLELMDEQGIDRALMFPTLASLVEERMRDDPEADPRRDPRAQRVDARDLAVRLRGPHLHHAGHHAARSSRRRSRSSSGWSSAAPRSCSSGPRRCPGFRGSRSFGLPEFDPFWEKVVEHDILVAHALLRQRLRALHERLDGQRQRDAPVPAAGVPDAVAVAPDRGRGRVADLPRRAVPVPAAEGRRDRERQQLGRAAARRTSKDLYKKMPQDFPEDPVEVIKRNIYISPFWEEDLGALAELIGVDHVLFGSDYPHPEGLADPAQLRRRARAALPDETVRKIMGGNLARLMNVEDAVVRVTDAAAAGTIPALTAGAADARSATQPAVVDGDDRAHLRRAARRGAHASAPRSSPSGVEPGDRVAIWAPNSAEWIVAAARPVRRPGAVLVPVNTRFKGAEAADDPRAQPAPGCSSPSPTSSAPTTSRMLARPAPSSPTSRPSSSLDGPAPAGTTGRGTTSSRRATDEALAEVDRRRGRRRRPTTRPTSSSPRAPPARRRASCRPTRRTLAGGHRLGRDDRPHRRRPLPDGQPVLPHVRAEGRASSPSVAAGRHDAPRAGVRRRPGARAGRGRADHRAARRADDLPVDPRPPATATTTTCRACASRSPAPPTSRSSSSAASSTSCRSRWSSPATASPRAAPRSATVARRRPRDHRHHRRPAPARLRAAHRRRRRQRRRRPASPARSCCAAAAIMSHYLDDPEATAAALSRRRLAAHRRPRRRRRRRLPAHRRPVEGHVHRRRVQRLPGRDRERPAAPPRHRSRPPSSASPTSASARSAWRSSCRAPGRRPTGRRDHRVVPRADGQLQGAAPRRARRRAARSTPPARS